MGDIDFTPKEIDLIVGRTRKQRDPLDVSNYIKKDDSKGYAWKDEKDIQAAREDGYVLHEEGIRLNELYLMEVPIERQRELLAEPVALGRMRADAVPIGLIKEEDHNQNRKRR